MKNDVVSVRPNFGRTQLLLPGLAVYASPENIEKLKSKLKDGVQESEDTLTHSSRFAELVRAHIYPFLQIVKAFIGFRQSVTWRNRFLKS